MTGPDGARHGDNSAARERDASAARGRADAAARERDDTAADDDTGGRDRDDAGRARNARPRDAAGRPMARGVAGVDRMPDDLALAPADAIAQAQRLLDDDLPFQAHEVLEGTWKATDGPERALWQGLAQLAVGLTHAQRGNATGAAALLRRGAERIEPFAADPPHGIDVAGLVAHASELAGRITDSGVHDVTPTDRRPQLRR